VALQGGEGVKTRVKGGKEDSLTDFARRVVDIGGKIKV